MQNWAVNCMTRGFLLRFLVLAASGRLELEWEKPVSWYLVTAFPGGVQKCRHNDKGDENIITTKEEFNQILSALQELAGVAPMCLYLLVYCLCKMGSHPGRRGGNSVITSWKWLDLYE